MGLGTVANLSGSLQTNPSHLFGDTKMGYDPRKAAKKQIDRSQQAQQDYIDGVRDTKKNPMQRAKAKKGKLRANFLAAVDNGKWEQGLDSVTEQEWKERAATVGGSNYAKGVLDGQAKIERFHEEFASFMDSVQQKIDQMPDDTPDQRLAKMRENAIAISKFKRSRTRR